MKYGKEQLTVHLDFLEHNKQCQNIKNFNSFWKEIQMLIPKNQWQPLQQTVE